MSRKKLTATNLEKKGTNSQNHFWKTVRFCPTCHRHGRAPLHDVGCKDIFVNISQDAEIPRRNSSKKVWNWFIRKFVHKEFLLKALKENSIKRKKKIWNNTIKNNENKNR